jgi:hypothetical protein
MSDTEKQVINIAVAITFIAIVLIGTLTLAGHHWPQAPREFPTKYPGITLRMP